MIISLDSKGYDLPVSKFRMRAIIFLNACFCFASIEIIGSVITHDKRISHLASALVAKVTGRRCYPPQQRHRFWCRALYRRPTPEQHNFMPCTHGTFTITATATANATANTTATANAIIFVRSIERRALIRSTAAAAAAAA
jgi:hypothetical protein